MRRSTPLVLYGLLFVFAPLALDTAQAVPPVQPPAPPGKPVTETLFGQSVTDNYRYFEAGGPELLDWMKAQGAYTRSVLDAIPERAALGQRISDFTGSFGFVKNFASYGGRQIYEERAPRSDNFDLVVHDTQGTRKIVDIATYMKAHGGTPAAINFIAASPDGSKVAVGLSEGGSEDASLSVYDASSGTLLGGPIDRAEFGVTSWSADSQQLYFIRLKALKPSEPGTEKYRDAMQDAWDLKAEPVVLYGSVAPYGPKFTPDETPALGFVPGAPVAVLESINGVQNEFKLWTAPAGEAADPAKAHWTALADRNDGITGLDQRGSAIFLLSHKNAPTFEVLKVKAGDPLSSATVLVPADTHRVIEGIHAASDALYVLARTGDYSQLLRVDHQTGRMQTLALPARGHIDDVFTDPRHAGVTFVLSSWVLSPTLYRYAPSTGRFADLHIGTRGDLDPEAFVVSDLEARAADGAHVPLTLVSPKTAAQPSIVVVEAYGSYGISNLADFSPRRAAFMKEGVRYGICGVRGGGELGEAWRLGGKDANKPNTWRDLIACGEDLIARGITTKQQLFILGGSAGGITMGRALEERPDLFAGVMDLVPAANPLRMEFSPNGPNNIPEFGSVSTEQGFKNLYEMDSIIHVKPGVTYPAILISTGLNDPRVSPWEPAKFAAALLADGSPNPVLLRIDEQAGHGVGSTRTQTDSLAADWIAFVKWRAGLPDWQPRF